MTAQDIAFGALCAWRENRGGGVPGMQSVINVLHNRANKRGTDIYTEAKRPYQFSSMTAPGDPNLIEFPSNYDAQWCDALRLMNSCCDGVLPDITQGATQYHALSMKTFPSWITDFTFTVDIAGQRFYK